MTFTAARVAPLPAEGADCVRAEVVPPKKLPTQLQPRFAAAWKALIKRPHFKSLPEALAWPNPEVRTRVPPSA